MNPANTRDSLLASCLHAAISNGERSDAESESEAVDQEVDSAAIFSLVRGSTPV